MDWKRFRRNRLALISAIFIGLLIVVSLLGYLVSPDKSPDANRIDLELALQSPGFQVDFIRTTELAEESQSLIKTMFKGKEDPNTWVSISSLNYPTDYTPFTKNGQIVPVELDATTSMLEDEWRRTHLKTKTFWLGTDRYGRDVLSRIILGARVSLLVGFISVFITLIIGTTLGLCSGYFGGWVDRVIMWLINVVWSLPSLLIAISISFAFQEKGLYQVFLAIGLSMWVELARIVRGQVLQVKEMEYIQAAKVFGFGSFRILFKHILPNIRAPIIVVCAANFASAILLEAGLSFLGLGVQPPTPSWGTMIKEHYSYIVFDAAHLAIIPGLCIMLLVMSFNFLGNGLRDYYDVNLK
ncbi:MAG: ABC transporter permease [Bacteroidia bacterium]